MASTKAGRIKQFCNKHGIAEEEYCANVANGLKWCYKCKSWVVVQGLTDYQLCAMDVPELKKRKIEKVCQAH